MLTLGEKVLVPTEVDAGAFPGEKLVTVNTQDGPISGFARAELIIEKSGNQYLAAVVREASESGTMVMLSGSFFTTTGLATLPPNARILKATA
ncbi:MAG TPA: hypothetical protein VME69_14035 [Methylocella sp.]|nr:hypothetical protein [Methylocella sp.]